MQYVPDIIQQIAAQTVAFRRDIHAYPELAWLEYRTTSKIAELFLGLGYAVTMGKEAVVGEARLTVPTEELCARHKARAIIQGALPSLVATMEDGLTGLWVDIPFGPGPVLAFRFDMDANAIEESKNVDHVPTSQGFCSQNTGVMHACGHDGHVAMGVGLGLALHMLKEQGHAPLRGTIRLIFQPAEEVGQGAKAMLAAGVMQGVQEVYGLHLGVQAQRPDTLMAGTTHFLANTTFEVSFSGQSAHSGIAPQEGRNALLAATTAIQGMLSIARHGHGETRVNIGQLHVDGAPNVVPCYAHLVGETRAVEKGINKWMVQEAERICQGAAHMWGCCCEFTCIGSCVNGFSDESLAHEVCAIAQDMPCFEKIIPSAKFMASEDFTWFLEHAQEQGGQGTYMQLGAALSGGHHSATFDFDEGALLRGVELLLRIIIQKTG